MKSQNEILIEFLFPKFTRPLTSRFISSFFPFESTKQFLPKRSNKTIFISLDKILKGDDKRTSIMIKNLPSEVTKDYINEILSDIGNINYIYLPHEKHSKKNLGFAFVNVVNYKNIVKLYNKLNGTKLKDYQMKRPIEVCYSKIQGKEGLAQMFGRKMKL